MGKTEAAWMSAFPVKDLPVCLEMSQLPLVFRNNKPLKSGL
jgi:hypothetical protein